MIKEILLPDLGEGIDSAEVSEISVSQGDTVGIDDTILVLESEKASMEIPAETNGIVSEILVSAGDEVKTGQLLIKIETSGVEITTATPTELKPQKQVPIEKEQTEQEPKLIITGLRDNIFASPGVRRLARELGINLETINGSGPKGRITKDDLNSYIKIQMAISLGNFPQPKKDIDFSQWGDIEVQKLTKINKITGQRLQKAWQEIPHVTQYDKADITDLDALRKELKKKGAETGVKVTFLPFLLKAASIVLREMPKFNSSLDHTDQNLVLKNYYHIGVAVDTPNGLTAPSVRDVDQKTIFDLSEELMDLSARARSKQLKPDEIKGSTFTISSLGGIGGTSFSPIVNPPEVAIMGVSRSEWKLVFNEETQEFMQRYIMPYSLSYDHRVIDGAAAAAFTTRFSQVLLNVEYFLN
mgnify:FL=1|jgi:pyruvate dehydrogenase E2 component (dihydrolipoamide acetyltransferase)|tara:strand:+ start:7925 stop:9166 length:1242 start_codon:yes stop_codon:yes gene_type:complete